ncbi:hypothetical protein ACFYZ9_09545 [Streptomyces sp. NPDC001691]|uniref:hypothetical protein n=1 Tax=unclassified Streptomyces TaxID=2593676 RepID=UPI00295007EA|nr:hypothetical protein [Streptomyces sp. SDr-06]
MTDARRTGSDAGGMASPGTSPAAGLEPFDDVYDRPDPRAYFQALGPLEYRTPGHAQQIFRRLRAALGTAGPADLTVLDLCCSYGINAALLNHDVTLEELYARYTSPAAVSMSTDELAAWDREFFASRRRRDRVRVIGLDIAARAVAYGLRTGLLAEGFAENLETAPPSPALRRAVRRTRLITVTGGASFLSHRTFRPLLTAARGPVWVAAFVLRTTSYAEIAGCLAGFGLATERALPTFPQRRFTGAREQRYAVDTVTASGQDPRGKECDGYFHAALHLSRPTSDVVTTPLDTLVVAG